ncbi:ThuA domain-containing protein [soil metagenome]
MKKALLFQGGWDGHRPQDFARRFQAELASHQIQVDLVDSLDCLDDAGKLKTYDLVIPGWTMGKLSEAQAKNLTAAVHGGVGLAGIHGFMGDAFRGCTDYEWMVGGHFVGHPHVGDYTVRLTAASSPITDGLPAEFSYRSEQYYLLVDPANDVLADSIYLYEGRKCVMPVAWTKAWGRGRVFYSALGHAYEELDQYPASLTLALRGMLWAAHLL